MDEGLPGLAPRDDRALLGFQEVAVLQNARRSGLMPHSSTTIWDLLGVAARLLIIG